MVAYFLRTWKLRDSSKKMMLSYDIRSVYRQKNVSDIFTEYFLYR